ncbi:MAG: flagellar filament capping protein FliD, partial [Shewanella sp.]
MGLTANGLGSGLDINGIVSALVNAEKAPKEAQFNVQEGKLNTQISALGALKSAISEFTDKLKPLSDPNTFNGFTSKLSSSDFLKVKTTSDAVAGSYNISVKQLAQSQKLGSAAVADADAAIGAGTLSFSVNGESFDIEVGAEDSLKDIVKKINGSDSNVGVTATIVNGDAGPQLVLTSDKTGEDNTITVTASADSSSALADTFTMTELQPPKNAIVTVDGVTITSNSNEIENAISGVNLTLTAADVDKTTTLTISPNTDGAKKAVTEFVDAYNSLMKTVQNMSGYDPETKKAGAF